MYDEPMTNAERQRLYRQRQAQGEGRTLRERSGRPQAEHGTPSRYRAGCHCTPCRAAQALRIARQRAARRAS
jgi:hypothetical protein